VFSCDAGYPYTVRQFVIRLSERPRHVKWEVDVSLYRGPDWK
jgi:hypothetical protein